MTDHRNRDDEQAILDLAAGDESVLESIYDKFAQRIYSLAVSILKDEALAEDAVQDVFTNIWLKSASYRPEMSAPGTWIMSVAHHKIVDIYRSRRRTTDHTIPAEAEVIHRIPDPALSVEQQVERNFNAQLVRAALAELPPEQSRPLVLSAWHGYSQSEIATLLKPAAGHGEDQNAPGNAEAQGGVGTICGLRILVYPTAGRNIRRNILRRNWLPSR